MKLHLPVLLRKALLACFSVCFAYSMGSLVSAANLTLGNEDSLTIDYADIASIPDLENGTLQLNGDTLLLLSNCGVGDGKAYTLLTGVSVLLDAEGNAIVLDSSNNFISHYFDTTRPGVGFWVNSTLQLTSDGSLQLVRHAESIKDAVAITTRQIGSVNYHYYTGVETYNCSSDNHGGAICGGDDSTIELSGNGSVTFSGNTAFYYGGAIDGSSNSTISLSGNGSVTFSGNSAGSGGGAIDGSTITLSGNGSVTFSGNTASSGGAIDGSSNSTISLSGNGSVTFSGNSAGSSGGAIAGSTITLSDNGSVEFSGNTASASDGYAYGGAINGYYGSTITLSGNGSVTFSGNTASASSSSSGGAIVGSTIELSDNDHVSFCENSAVSYHGCGGAIYGDSGSTIELSGNGSVEFSGNTASSSRNYAYGGAIYGGDSGTITLSGNGSVTFSENTASASSSSESVAYAYGGAINGYYGSTIELSGNDSVTFSGNTASYGGAIGGGGDSAITLSGNGSVTFSGNSASASGGAIDGHTIELSGNDSVAFSGNTASSGGAIAIYGGTIELSGNGSVAFSGNTVSASYNDTRGGAICGYGNLSIRNNDSVLFEKNAEISGATYRLRSISAGGSGAVISLSASAGKSIEFRDSVYIASGSTVNLNAYYTDANGMVHKQTGDIIFTGAYTEQHLNKLLAADGLNRTATETEILNSRTTEVQAMTNLYGGRLRVEDKAVLKLNGGLTVAEGGNASVEVKAAELNVGSHALSMVSGSSLALADGAKVTATELTITTGATLTVLGSVSTEPLTEQVAALTLSEETVAGFDATRAVNTGSVSVLDGDLTLESGSLLSLDDAYLELSGNLFFDVAEGEEKIALDIAPGIITEANNQVVLFNVDGVVTFGFDGLTASADNGMVYCVKAEDYFTGNRVTESMKLVYDSSTGMVYLENAAGAVPEPTTTTLSLLALAALAARRRRK